MAAVRRLRDLARAGLVVVTVVLAPSVSPGDGTALDEPLMPFSTYLGGSYRDHADAVAIGPDGVVWVAATTSSSNFPGSPKNSSINYDEDVVVVRIDPATHTVLSTIRLGGLGGESVAGLAIDAGGNAYVAGKTSSVDFPLTGGRFGSTPYGSVAFYVARVLPDGSGFAWAYVFGGSSAYDSIAGICVTADGDPVVAGQTYSADFPLVSPLVAAFGGGESDAFVVRLRADGTGPVFSTYLGGSYFDEAMAVCLAPDGGIVVAGESGSDELLANAQQLVGAPWDASYYQGFIAELDPSGTGVRRIGRMRPGLRHLATGAGQLVVTGLATLQAGLPIASVPEDQYEFSYLLSFDAATWESRGGAYLGPWNGADASGLGVGSDGTVWVAGGGWGAPILSVPGAVRPLLGDAADAFVAAFESKNLAQVFGTYLGGNGEDDAYAVAVAPDGSAWVAGVTASTNFPTAHAAQSTLGWVSPYTTNGFVAQLRAGDPPTRPAAVVAPTATVDGGHSVRVGWSPGDATATMFAIDRTEVPDSGAFLGWTRVVLVPASAVEWLDASVWPDRTYRYSVQAVNDAGGSPASGPIDAAVPATLDVSLESGIGKNSARRRGAYFYWTHKLHLRGQLANNSGGALDPSTRGLRVVAGNLDDGSELLSVPPGDRRWQVRRNGVLELGRRGARMWVRIDPATGDFEVRLRNAQGVGEFVYSQVTEQRRLRVVVGNDVGSTAPAWRATGRRKIQTP